MGLGFITGLTKKTPQRIQLDAGAVMKNVQLDGVETAEAMKAIVASILKGETTSGSLLGATRGGGTINIAPTVRNLEADGMREPIVGSELVDEWTTTLQTTLLEVTEDTLSLALPMLEWSGSGGLRIAKLGRNIKEEHYLENVMWVGNTGFGLMAVLFENALHTGGLSMAVQDKGNGTIPVTISAHSNGYAFEEDYLPVKFFLLDEKASA